LSITYKWGLEQASLRLQRDGAESDPEDDEYPERTRPRRHQRVGKRQRMLDRRGFTTYRWRRTLRFILEP
jgi:hypothetical protein